MKSFSSRFLFAQSGATAIEYGLITLMMSFAIIVSVPSLREAVQSLYLIVSASFASAGS